MPNFCSNIITIRGEESQRIAIGKTVQDAYDNDTLEFRSFECDVSDYGNSHHIFLQTAWVPPMAYLESLSKEYPELTLTVSYWEGGMAFCGFRTLKAGVELQHQEYDLGCDKDSMKQLREVEAEHGTDAVRGWEEVDEDDCQCSKCEGEEE